MQNEWLVNLSKSASWKLQKHSLTARRQLGNTFMSVYQILCSISKINEDTLVVDFMNLTLCYKGHLHWERLWRKHCWPKWNENVLVFHSGKTYLASKLYEGLLRSGIWKYLKRGKYFSLRLSFNSWAILQPSKLSNLSLSSFHCSRNVTWTENSIL